MAIDAIAGNKNINGLAYLYCWGNIGCMTIGCKFEECLGINS